MPDISVEIDAKNIPGSSPKIALKPATTKPSIFALQ
jgi:hypothetical protein